MLTADWSKFMGPKPQQGIISWYINLIPFKTPYQYKIIQKGGNEAQYN